MRVPPDGVAGWLGAASDEAQPARAPPPSPLRSLPPRPPRHALIVFVDCGDGKAATSAAAAAAAAGYETTACVEGGARVLAAAEAAPPPDLPSISAPALALALEAQRGGGGGGGSVEAEPGNTAAGSAPRRTTPRRVVVVDVRRHDERALYGSLPGAIHIPAPRLPAVLRAPAAAFEATHGAPPPGPADAAVFVSRGATRAAWAAVVAVDAGVGRCLAFRAGAAAAGAALGGGGPAHHARYGEGGAPPPPLPPPAAPPAEGAAKAELSELGLV